MTGLKYEWQSGDTTAFEGLFRQYQRLVFRNAYIITGTREEAEDILQEVFVAVWNSRGTYDPAKGSMATWLHRITTNKCLEKHRKKSLPSISLENTPAVATLTDDMPVNREDYDMLLEALRRLDTKHRVVLVLRYFNDLSYDEIAYILDIPLGTVKSRLNQSLKLLRGRLDMQNGETQGV
jgi:RNA polymerase sigma factor (sigma-70 family)